MAANEAPDSDAAACDFLEMYDRDRGIGRKRSLAEYQQRFPGHEARIADELAAVSGARAKPDDAAVATPGRIGRYRLLHELGRGGQAVVWLAHDEMLDRKVALKLLTRDSGWLSQGRRERLQHEASALARLDHPGICAIYEAELGGELPFLAMRYVVGETLATHLRRAREQPDPESRRLLATLPDRPARIAAVLELGEKIARALHTAHDCGIVHRDVKPQNVMLTEDDQPVLLDFGISRTRADDDSPTTAQGVFGSIAYLAPECFTNPASADRRSDVYSLGVLLHECLTLERPHAAQTATALLTEITRGTRRDLTHLNRSCARDTALVLETALETDPARRYATALDLAEDLRRLRCNEPIVARPIGTSLRARRWVKRHPVLAVAASLAMVALVVSAILVAYLMEQRRGLLAWQKVLEVVSSSDHPTPSLGRVLAAAPLVPSAKLDGPLIELLTRSTAQLELTEQRLGDGISGTVSFSADDRHLLVPTASGDLLRVDVETGECTLRTPMHAGANMYLGVCGDFRTAVSSGHDGRVCCFDPTTMAELPLPAAIARSNEDVDTCDDPRNRRPRLPVLSNDGKRLALVGFGFQGTLLVTEVGAAGRHWRIDRPGCWAQQVMFSPDGSRLVVHWRPDQTHQGATSVRVYASADGGELAELDTDRQETLWGAFAADGERFATAGHDGRIRVFDTASWRCIQELRTAGEELQHVYWVGFARDGRSLASLGFEGLTVFELATDRRIAQFQSATARPFHRAAFSDDGGRLAAVVKDGTVRIYDTSTWTQISTAPWSHRYPNELVWNHAGDRLAFEDGRGVQVVRLQAAAPLLRPHRAAIVSLEFLADGGHVLTASRDGTAAVTDLATGTADPVMRHPGPVSSAHLSKDDEAVLTACSDGVVRIWARRDAAAPRLELRAHEGAVVDAMWIDEDRRVLSIGADGGVRMFHSDTGAEPVRLRGHDKACLCAAVDADLGLIATGGEDHRVLVHDLQGRFLAALDTLPKGATPGISIRGNASALAFDRLRRRLVVANRRDTMVIYALDGWQPTWVQPNKDGQEYSMHVALRNGGHYYATAHSGVCDWTFVDATTLTTNDVGSTNFPSAIVSVLRFSPDGTLLLVASRDDSVSLWDLERRERRLDLRGKHGGIRAAVFDRAGAWVATGSQDGTLRAWPVQPLPFAQRYHARLAGSSTRR